MFIVDLNLCVGLLHIETIKITYSEIETKVNWFDLIYFFDKFSKYQYFI